MNYCKCSAFFWLAGLAFPLSAQSTFFKTFGGPGNDLARAVQQTPAGGFIVAGETYSFGAGSRDVYLFLTDSAGNSIWANTYGGNSDDYAQTLDQTNTGGFIVGAHTASFGQGGHDHYFINTDGNGDTLFTKLYGGGAPDGIYSLYQTTDGGHIMGGHTSSFGAGAHDFYMIRTDEQGTPMWSKTYGSSGGDFLRSIVPILQTPVAYHAFVGASANFGVGSTDILMGIVHDDTGDTLLAKTYGGSGNDHAFSIKEISPLGLIIAGHTNSDGAGGMDILLLKTNISGDIEWARTYGGPGNEFGYSVQQTADGGFVVVGTTNSFGAGPNNVYAIRTDANGDTLWTRAYGGTGSEEALSVAETTDGGFIIAGSSSSFGQGVDALLIKTDELGNVLCNMYNTSTQVGNPALSSTNPTLLFGSGTISSSSPTIVGSAQHTGFSCLPLAVQDEDASENLVEVFPNPANTRATLRYSLDRPSNIAIRIFDQMGRSKMNVSEKVVSSGTKEIVIDTKKWGSGIYMVVFSTNNSRSIFKLVITK